LPSCAPENPINQTSILSFQMQLKTLATSHSLSPAPG
jgi:hypothetical protein